MASFMETEEVHDSCPEKSTAQMDRRSARQSPHCMGTCIRVCAMLEEMEHAYYQSVDSKLAVESIQHLERVMA